MSKLEREDGIVNGLLAKARTLRNRFSNEGGLHEEISFDSESGISKEDQSEILEEIENVARRSRIEVTPEAFTVRAVKRGVLFPILVNVLTILVLGIGAGAFYFLFQRGETRISRAETASITAEGKLIAEVKREAEARLQEKNQEIGRIQDRLAEIDREKQDLQSAMDTKVGQRERDLRAAMAAELEAERQRLRGQGLSDETVDTRLKELEAQKNAEFTRQLDAFRAEAEVEKKKSEENLKNVQAEFTVNLARANAERQQVLEDSKKREDDLRSRLSEQTRALESAKTEAEQALKSISAQREREDLVSGQLVGLYEAVKSNIASREYDNAIRSLQAVREYVNREDVMVLPGIAKRRDFDLFVVESLTSLVKDEVEKAKTDTTSLLAAADQIADVRERVDGADDFLRAGNIAEAEKAYAEALRVIPGISKSHEYLLQRGNEIDRQEQSRGAAAAFPQANNLLAQGKPEEALPLYLQILARYPLSAQAADAISGIQAAAGAMNGALASQRSSVEALNRQIAALRQELSARSADVSRIKAGIASLIEEGGNPDALDLETLFESLREKYTARQPSGSAQPGVTDSQSAADTQRAEALQNRLSVLDQSYKRYAALEDPVLAGKGVDGLFETKAYLDSFLGSKPVDETFPGLLSRIKRYDLGFQAAGRADALQDALDIVVALSQFSTPDRRKKLFDEKLVQYAKDPAMTSFLKELQSLMK